ncbi:MAG: hypothetical protein AAB588_06540 [Patescibacteria group bacterium]
MEDDTPPFDKRTPFDLRSWDLPICRADGETLCCTKDEAGENSCYQDAQGSDQLPCAIPRETDVEIDVQGNPNGFEPAVSVRIDSGDADPEITIDAGEWYDGDIENRGDWDGHEHPGNCFVPLQAMCENKAPTNCSDGIAPLCQYVKNELGKIEGALQPCGDGQQPVCADESSARCDFAQDLATPYIMHRIQRGMRVSSTVLQWPPQLEPSIETWGHTFMNPFCTEDGDPPYACTGVEISGSSLIRNIDHGLGGTSNSTGHVWFFSPTGNYDEVHRIMRGDLPWPSHVGRWLDYFQETNPDGVAAIAHICSGADVPPDATVLDPRIFFDGSEDHDAALFAGIALSEHAQNPHRDLVRLEIGATDPRCEVSIINHSLRAGYARDITIVGGSDGKCIAPGYPGQVRTQCHLPNGQGLREYVNCLRRGPEAVTDGRSRILDFAVNGVQGGNTLTLAQNPDGTPPTARVTARIVGYLPEEPRQMNCNRGPWNAECGRDQGLQIFYNGQVIHTVPFPRDTVMRDLSVELPISTSGVMYLYAPHSSMTNWVVVEYGGRPLVPFCSSVHWKLDYLSRAYELSRPNIAYLADRQDYDRRYEAARNETAARLENCQPDAE